MKTVKWFCQQELRLALDITNSASGKPGGVMISLDQGKARIPITALTEQAGVVHLETKSVGGLFDGKLSGNGAEIAGDWQQGGKTLAVVFKRLTKTAKLERPQDPKKPFPYDEEEVVVENSAGGVKLAGTLTLPRGTGPWGCPMPRLTRRPRQCSRPGSGICSLTIRARHSHL